MADVKNDRNYIPSLDGLRTISIALVFFAHALHVTVIPGGLGVTIFFFISGYLITTLLLREHERSGTIHFRSFYERRLLRLMPPLLITLALGIVLVLTGIAEGDLNPMGLTSQVLFFFNYWSQGSTTEVISGTTTLWSLSVEEHFYILYPLLLLISLRNRWPSWWIAGFALFVLGWRTFKFVWLGASEWEIYALTDTRIDSLLWGCLLATLMESPRFRQGPARPAVKWSLLGAGFALLIVSLVLRDALFRSTLRYTLQGIAFLPIFYFAIREPDSWLFKPLNWGWMRKLGVYSYTFYLVHYILLGILVRSPIGGNRWLVALVGGTLAVIYSALMYEYVEAPVRVLRARMAAAAQTRGGAIGQPTPPDTTPATTEPTP